mgnify:CR=1 FL=1
MHTSTSLLNLFELSFMEFKQLTKHSARLYVGMQMEILITVCLQLFTKKFISSQDNKLCHLMGKSDSDNTHSATANG